jgi:hypothetical protein
MVIHDVIYDVGKFVDEHPGGEEVLLDVGGQDATEAFEDVGHSDEARETLEQLKVGTLKRNVSPAFPPGTKAYHRRGITILLTHFAIAQRPQAQDPPPRRCCPGCQQRLSRLRRRPLRHHPHRRRDRLRRLPVPPAAAAGWRAQRLISLYPAVLGYAGTANAIGLLSNDDVFGHALRHNVSQWRAPLVPARILLAFRHVMRAWMRSCGPHGPHRVAALGTWARSKDCGFSF